MVDDYGEKLWATDKIINSKRYKGTFQYQIKWCQRQHVDSETKAKLKAPTVIDELLDFGDGRLS